MTAFVPESVHRLVSGPVAIFGGGISGRAAAALLDSARVDSRIFDAADGAEFGPAEAGRHRVVVYSPGFAPGHPWLELARAAGAACWGEVDFASLFWKGRTVAVTGTNGKTTLTEFLVHALEASGRRAYAAGNIGRAFCQTVADTDGGAPDDIAVCEVSSFQAETLRHFHAEALLWTNLAEDHLERHGTMAAYFDAKARLATRSNQVFAGSSVRAAAVQWNGSSWTGRTPTIWVETERLAPDRGLAGTDFEQAPQRENFALAAAWWTAGGLPPQALYAAARTFRLGRHRLSRTAEVAGVTYWNDSKATNFHAVEAALGRFPAPVFLIAGGKAKGGDIAGFVRRAAPRVREMFLIGDTAPLLAEACGRLGVPHRRCPGLSEAVEAAAAAAAPGDQVLLSPGFASFDLFRNYQDRGERFEAAVAGLHPPQDR